MIRSLPFGDELESLWNSINISSSPPFFTYAWHKHWWDTFHDDHWKQKYLVSEAPHGIIPLYQIGSEVYFSGGEEIADYLDCLGSPSDIPSLWKQTLDHLKQEGITALTLSNIPEHSPTLEVYRSNPQARVEQIDTTPFIDMPNTWEEHLLSLSRKDRHEIRRKLKKFELEQPGISFVFLDNPTLQDMKDLITLMKLNPDKQQLFTRPHMEEFFLGLPQYFTASLQMAVLRKNTTPIASLLAFKTEKEILLYNSGFDERNYSGAGLYLKIMHLKWTIEQGLIRYNFLQGNERYKYDLGAKDLPVYRVKLNLE